MVDNLHDIMYQTQLNRISKVNYFLKYLRKFTCPIAELRYGHVTPEASILCHKRPRCLFIMGCAGSE